ncbi:MAG: insulinase family protein [Planctomycetota bacterium]
MLAIPFRVPVLIALVLGALGAAERPLRLPHAHNQLPTDPAVTWGVLDNGLIYAVQRNDEPEDKLSLRLYLDTGSLMEQDTERGIAHYLEHMAFNGSEHFPPGELVTTLQELGVDFGRHLNAHTGFEETVYKLDLPDAEPDTLDRGLLVLSDMAGRLTLSEDEVERERGIILAEMRDRDSPGLRRARHTYGSIYAGTRVAERFPIGVEATVSAFDAAALRAYYHRWYIPARTVLAVVGDIAPETVVPLIETHFAGLTNPDPLPRPAPIAPVEAAELAAAVHVDDELPRSLIRWIGVVPGEPESDGPETRRRELYRELYTAVVDRRFANLAETADAPILGGGFALYHTFEHHSALIQVQVKGERLAAALRLLEHERRRLREHGITAGELAVAVAARRAALDRAVEQADSRSNARLAAGLYLSVRDDRTRLSPQQQRDLLEPWLAAATPAAVEEAAGVPAWVAPRRAVLSLEATTAPPHGDTEPTDWLLQHWQAASEETVAAPEQTAAPSWAYGEPPEDVPALEPRRLAHDILAAELPNAISLRALPRSAQPGEVMLRATLFTGPQPPPRGYDRLAADGFQAAGLGAHDATALRAIMAGNSIRIDGPQIEPGRITFDVSCLPGELPFACQYLAALITDPGWRPEPYRRAIEAMEQQLAAAPLDLDWRVTDHWALLTGSTMGQDRPLRAHEAAQLQPDAMRAWLEPLLATAPLEIAVVGDVDPGKVLPTLATWFAGLAPRTPVPAIEDLTAPGALTTAPPLPHGEHRFSYDGTVARSVVRVAWPTDDTADIAFRRRMGLVGKALNEILRNTIRETLGQAYSPHAWHDASTERDGAGALVAHMAVERGQAETVLAALDTAVATLRQERLDPDLFNRLINPVRAGLSAWRDTNRYWLGSVVAGSSHRPQQLDWATSMAEAYATMDAAALEPLIDRYLGGERLVLIGTSTGQRNAEAPAETTTAQQDQQPPERIDAAIPADATHIHLRIDADDQLWLQTPGDTDGKWRALQPASLDEALAAHVHAGAVVDFSASGETPYGFVAEVIDQLQASGLTDIRFRTASTAAP